MKKITAITVILVALAVIVLVGYKFWNTYKGIWFANRPTTQNIVSLIQNSQTPGVNKTSLPLSISDGYTLSIYSQGLNDPRVLVSDPNGVILVSLTSAGKVVALVNGGAINVISGLNQPHGLAFSGNELFVAETNQVAAYSYDPATYKATGKHKIIDLPGGGEHFTRSLLITGGKLYISVGSDCNACVETDPRRASIYISNLDGSGFRPYATGLRNSVFMAVNPNTGEIWATNMGRDFLGDNVPPDTINIIKDGLNYGWPYCYGNKIIDNETNPGGSKFDCGKMTPPQFSLQAHSAPLGLAFLGQDLVVSFHGSWNRTVPTGYKVVKFHNGVQQDFVTGWIKSDGTVLGRPVAVLVKGGDIYLSDDKAGVIYLLKHI